jgi:hypothetical protein
VITEAPSSRRRRQEGPRDGEEMGVTCRCNTDLIAHAPPRPHASRQ